MFSTLVTILADKVLTKVRVIGLLTICRVVSGVTMEPLLSADVDIFCHLM